MAMMSLVAMGMTTRIAAQFHVTVDLLWQEDFSHLDVRSQVRGAQFALKPSHFKYHSLHLLDHPLMGILVSAPGRVARIGPRWVHRHSHEKLVQSSFPFYDEGAQSYGLCKHAVMYAARPSYLLRTQIQVLGQFQDVARTGKVVELSCPRQAHAAAVQEIVDFFAGESLDLPPLLANVGAEALPRLLGKRPTLEKPEGCRGCRGDQQFLPLHYRFLLFLIPVTKLVTVVIERRPA